MSAPQPWGGERAHPPLAPEAKRIDIVSGVGPFRFGRRRAALNIRRGQGDTMLKMLAATAVAALLATGAHAATYQFNFGFTSQSGSPFEVAVGTLTTSDTLNADGGYDVTGITGTVSSPGAGGFPTFSAITGLSDFDLADNVLYPSDPRVDLGGIAFTSASGGYFNLYDASSIEDAAFSVQAQDASYDYVVDYAPSYNGTITSSHVTLAVTQIPTSAAPEPGTWALMMAGVGLAGAALRRRRAATLAAA